MRIILQLTIFHVVVLFLLSGTLHAQYASKKIARKQQQYVDSLKQVDYPYLFPIWGQKIYKRGFDIPYPGGLMANYLYADQGILIDNLQLGLQTQNVDIPPTPVDFIQFGENRSVVNTVNFRPDLWIFPFLGVYGIFGYGTSRTTVEVTAPVTFTSIVEQNLTTAGFGVNGAFGVGPAWVSLDGNWTWSKPDLLEEPVQVKTFGVRVGHTFTNPRKPYKNFAIWIGGMRLRMKSETRGSISLQDALPPETWDRADEIIANYWDWYNGLNPNNPLDQAKIEVADRVLTPIVENIENRDGSAVVSYGIDKSPTQEWNMVLGAQYQFNKKWMLRSEGGIVGDRKSFLLSLNYRFLL